VPIGVWRFLYLLRELTESVLPLLLCSGDTLRPVDRNVTCCRRCRAVLRAAAAVPSTTFSAMSTGTWSFHWYFVVPHNGLPWSSPDQDHDTLTLNNCAAVMGGSWWHSRCGLFWWYSRCGSLLVVQQVWSLLVAQQVWSLCADRCQPELVQSRRLSLPPDEEMPHDDQAAVASSTRADRQKKQKHRT